MNVTTDPGQNGLANDSEPMVEDHLVINVARESSRRTWIAAAVALMLFAAVCSALLAAWSAQNGYPPNGDEPHYAILSQSISHFEFFDLSQAYAREFSNHDLWAAGPSAGAALTTDNTQLIAGPNGLYSIHGLGLPALLAGPTAVAGLIGARVAMIVIATAGAAAAWGFASHFTPVVRIQAGSVIAAVLAMPFITGATQLYPDIPAGVLFLAGSLGLLGGKGPRRWLPFLAAAFLPWLQIKFLFIAIVLGFAALIRVLQDRMPVKSILSKILVPAISMVLLAGYNTLAIGALSPSQPSDIEFSPAVLERTMGLLLDQNQGILFNNPLLLIFGLLGLVPLWRRDRVAACAMFIGASSMLVLNAMHPLDYGGGSFSGRFAWTSAVILLGPCVAGLAALSRWSEKAFWAIVASGFVFQLFLFYRYVDVDRVPSLFNRSALDLLLPAYGIMFPGSSNALPGWYSLDWAFGSVRNWLWLGAIILILVAGFLIGVRARHRTLLSSAALLGVAICAAGGGISTLPPASQASTFPANYLKVRSWSATRESPKSDQRKSVRVAIGPMLPAYGTAGIHLQAGTYTLTFRISGAPNGQAIPAGQLAVRDGQRQSQILVSAAVPANDASPQITVTLPRDQLILAEYSNASPNLVGVESLSVVRR